MATLNKALTRPAAIAGIPLAVRDGQRGHRPAGGLCQLLPDITAYSGWLEMKAKARTDIHYFGLLWLAFKTVAVLAPINILVPMPCWQTAMTLSTSRSLLKDEVKRARYAG